MSALDAEQMLQLPGQDKTSLPEDKEAETEKEFHSKALLKIKDLIQSAIDEAMGQDPIMTHSMNFKHCCDVALTIYVDLYKDYKRKIKQTQISDWITKKKFE